MSVYVGIQGDSYFILGNVMPLGKKIYTNTSIYNQILSYARVRDINKIKQAAVYFTE